GVADLEEQAKALFDTELSGIAEFRDAAAFDVFHHQVRLAGISRAAVDQAGDIRVLQLRQDLPLAREAAHRGAGIESSANELDRHALRVDVVGAVGEIYRPHSARFNQAGDPVRPKALADPTVFRRWFGAQSVSHVLDARGRAAGIARMSEQRLQFLANAAIHAELVEGRDALCRSEWGQLSEESL